MLTPAPTVGTYDICTKKNMFLPISAGEDIIPSKVNFKEEMVFVKHNYLNDMLDDLLVCYGTTVKIYINMVT